MISLIERSHITTQTWGRRVIHAILVCVVLTVSSSAAIDAQSPVCLPSDSTVPAMIASIERLVSLNDADSQILRDSLELPQSSTPHITLVTTESTCKKVRDAMNAAYQTPGQSRQIWVVKTTDGFAALDPLQPYSEWRFLFFVSKKYEYKGIVLY